MLFQAFIDDSKSEGDPPFFVLAGYIGRADMWAKFEREWQRALEMRGPRIAYFKYREALHGEGEFNGASEALRMERASLMRNIIEQFAPFEFSIAFRVDEYEHAFAIVPPSSVHNPYYFAAFELIMRLARNIDHFGGSFEDELQVIFDNQAMEQARIIAGWDRLRHKLESGERINDLPPIAAKLMRTPPAFRDDKRVLPLQAADMQATWVRLLMEAIRDGRPDPPVPGKKKGLPGLAITATQETLNNAAHVVRVSLVQQGRVFREERGSCGFAGLDQPSVRILSK